jgi:hypothetical protein
MDAGPELPHPPQGASCVATPQTIVSPSQLPSHPSDTNVVIGGLTATPAGLYYATSTIRQDRAGTFVAGSLWRIVSGEGSPVQVADGALFMTPVLMATSLLLGELGLNGFPDVIATLPLAGGPPRTIYTLSNQDIIFSPPVTDGTSVYFIDPEGIVSVPLDPDAGAAPVTLATMDPGDGFGVFGPRLLFIHPQGEIDTVPLPLRADSVPTRLGTTAAGAVDVLPCGSKACWRAGINQIDSIDPVGGPLTTIATLSGAVAEVVDLAFDGASFYVVGTDNTTGSAEALVRVPANGGAPVVLAQAPSAGGGSVALDSSCIYWSNGTAIFSLARPQ